MSLKKYATPGERKVVTALVNHLLEKGYEIDVYDGEETTLNRSTDAEAIFEALCTTDHDSLIARNPGVGLVAAAFYLVWGNALDGSEVIADHSDTPFANSVSNLAYSEAGVKP